ncbi:MAG: valine--tRNA ligase, partial [Brevibacterium sp.]|nr:valine--tRNA ligase [Brevibacterium sp.]
QLAHPDSAVDPELLVSVAAVLSEIRRAKTESKVSQKTQVRSLTIHAPAAVVAAIDSARADLTAAGRVQHLTTEEYGEEITVTAIDFVEQD